MFHGGTEDPDLHISRLWISLSSWEIDEDLSSSSLIPKILQNEPELGAATIPCSVRADLLFSS